MDVIFLSIGLVTGALASWFVAKYKFSNENGSIPYDQVKDKYVLKEVFDALQQQADLFREDLSEKEQELRKMDKLLISKEQESLYLKEKLQTEQAQINQLQQRFQTEFENVANRLLEEKSQKFAKQNQQQLGDMLHPLKERIKEFETNIERRYIDKTKDLFSLKKEIEQLRDLNLQLSEDANNLASALKGDNKTQGDWGEFQLELLLEKAGLAKDIHFTTQKSFKDTEVRTKRPDFIIHLPNKKHLIIDSKVSLVAYEKYY
ncbi:MAG: DNA recombination protein RmuC, partial [Bacteroidota bacterium]